MSEFSIREYREEDIPALSLLWQNTFDDSEALIADFFRLLPGMGTGLTAVKDGIPRGAAYVISGMELVNPYGHTVPCGYIYAVAVDESCRGLGMGSALTRAAAEKGLELGAAFICTLPAGDSLYDWYNELIGVSCALCRKTELIKCFPFAEVAPISAAEYGVLREKLLCGREHLRLAPLPLSSSSFCAKLTAVDFIW